MSSSTQNKSKKLGQSLIFMLLITAYAFSQSDSGPARKIKEITELEHQRAAAVVHHDTDFLDRITAADSVRILPGGMLETKSQLLSDLKSGVLIYKSIDVGELSVKIYGDAAVVAGVSAFQGQRNGKAFSGRCRFSRVWINHGGWQEVLFQLTPIPEG